MPVGTVFQIVPVSVGTPVQKFLGADWKDKAVLLIDSDIGQACVRITKRTVNGLDRAVPDLI